MISLSLFLEYIHFKFFLNFFFGYEMLNASQESRIPSSLGNCCFSSGEEFYSTKNKEIEVGKAMRSSSKQNKSIKL